MGEHAHRSDFRGVPRVDARETKLKCSTSASRRASRTPWNGASKASSRARCRLRFATSRAALVGRGLRPGSDSATRTRWISRARCASINNSGEDYENAQVRLVVGVIRLVDEIANLARRLGRPGQLPTTPAPAQRGARTRQARTCQARPQPRARRRRRPGANREGRLSEYFLYTVGATRHDSQWLVEAHAVVEHQRRSADELLQIRAGTLGRFGHALLPVQERSKPASSATNHCPMAQVKAFRFVSDDLLYAFIGRSSVKYIPVNEQVELELGQRSGSDR